MNGIAIPNTPITSKSAVPAAPSSWSNPDNTNNKRRKSMVGTQDTIMPSTQSSDPEKHSGTADKFGVPNAITALETSMPSTSREYYPEENRKMEVHDSDVASLQTCDTSIENADYEKRMDFPQMMEDCGIDRKMMEDCGLDLKKTMDFALFQDVCCRLVFPTESHECMARFVKGQESEDIKRLPPLCVVLYNDLVETEWGWDRLLPWMTGYVLFEDYFGYLRQYFLQNATSISELHTAATECVAAENELSTTIGAPGRLISIGDVHFELSLKIKDKANHLINAPTVPADVSVPAACIMCITEEAKLMSEVFTKWTAQADKGSAELLQQKFEFSNEVRKVAFDILTTYKGPYSMQVSASMLGMKMEAGIAFKLLQRNYVDHDEIIYICEEIREFTLELLRIIRKCFPQECAIEYCPIDRARAIIGKSRAEHLAEPSRGILSADEVSAVNMDGIAIPNTPITSKITVPAAPSSWSDSDNTNNKKRERMIGTQDTIMPCADEVSPIIRNGIAIPNTQITSQITQQARSSISRNFCPPNAP